MVDHRPPRGRFFSVRLPGEGRSRPGAEIHHCLIAAIATAALLQDGQRGNVCKSFSRQETGSIANPYE